MQAREAANREAARSVFPDDGALVAAEARLAAIEAEIADTLNPDQEAAQAA